MENIVTSKKDVTNKVKKLSIVTISLIVLTIALGIFCVFSIVDNWEVGEFHFGILFGAMGAASALAVVVISYIQGAYALKQNITITKMTQKTLCILLFTFNSLILVCIILCGISLIIVDEILIAISIILMFLAGVGLLITDCLVITWTPKNKNLEA